MMDFDRLSPFDVPNSNFTRGWDIKPAGDVAGDFQDTTGKFPGLSRTASGYTTIDFPGAVVTRAFGINPGGEIVGAYVDSGRNTHGFVLHR
jgi:hypothetical protein